MIYHIIKLDAVDNDDGSIRYLADQPYLVTSSRYLAPEACFTCAAKNSSIAWIEFVSRVKK